MVGTPATGSVLQIVNGSVTIEVISPVPVFVNLHDQPSSYVFNLGCMGTGVLQCVAVYCSVLRCVFDSARRAFVVCLRPGVYGHRCVAVFCIVKRCSLLQFVAVCCRFYVTLHDEITSL